MSLSLILNDDPPRSSPQKVSQPHQHTPSPAPASADYHDHNPSSTTATSISNNSKSNGSLPTDSVMKSPPPNSNSNPGPGPGATPGTRNGAVSPPGSSAHSRGSHSPHVYYHERDRDRDRSYTSVHSDRERDRDMRDREWERDRDRDRDRDRERAPLHRTQHTQLPPPPHPHHHSHSHTLPPPHPHAHSNNTLPLPISGSAPLPPPRSHHHSHSHHPWQDAQLPPPPASYWSSSRDAGSRDAPPPSGPAHAPAPGGQQWEPYAKTLTSPPSANGAAVLPGSALQQSPPLGAEPKYPGTPSAVGDRNGGTPASAGSTGRGGKRRKVEPEMTERRQSLRQTNKSRIQQQQQQQQQQLQQQPPSISNARRGAGSPLDFTAGGGASGGAGGDPQEMARMEEETRLVSSDLDDSEEVWIGELGRYVLETRMRTVDVENWFEKRVKEKSEEVSRGMGHRYNARLVTIHAMERSRDIERDLLSTVEHHPYPHLHPHHGYHPHGYPHAHGHPHAHHHGRNGYVHPDAHYPPGAGGHSPHSYNGTLDGNSSGPASASATGSFTGPHGHPYHPHHHHHHYPPGLHGDMGSSIDDAARELEDIVADDERPGLEDGKHGKKKGRGRKSGVDGDGTPASYGRKRHAPNVDDDAWSDFSGIHTPAHHPHVNGSLDPSKKSGAGLGARKGTKRRKLGSSPAPSESRSSYREGMGVGMGGGSEMDAAEELESYVDDELLRVAPQKLKISRAGKKRARDGSVREGSPNTDSSFLGLDDTKPPTPSGRSRSRKKTAMNNVITQGGSPASTDAFIDEDGNLISSEQYKSVPGGLYALDERLPRHRPKDLAIGQATLVRRAVQLEEAQRKIWLNIAKKEVVKAYKFQTSSWSNKIQFHKKLSNMCVMQSKRGPARTNKSVKDVQIKAKRLVKEMLVFWKKNEKEEREGRKKAEKEALEKAKLEEEKREAQRQARKLEFLITQTELYSHFVGSKLKTSEAEGNTESTPAEGAATDENAVPAEPEETLEDGEESGDGELKELDFGDADTTNLRRHARRNAQDAVNMARQKANEFDKSVAADRKKQEAKVAAKNKGSSPPPEPSAPIDFDSDELNFQNPTLLSDQPSITTPRMLNAQLKEYQIKGLNWLATLYEQGINGILADEMGLGKTVQSISLLAYLAETHNIWGPFLVIAPSSTLHNWQQELTRFVPTLKTIPYWGTPKERQVLRKFWNKDQIYDKNSPFHVLVTSYSLVVLDEAYFQRMKWQYMVLDEAQAIKSSSSARWKTLLGFNCRNRLLLTGTPIQNSMQELWALLHFIMPTLFDSHDEFSEWFAKDIENHAENKGGSNLNEHQLRRLHMILKPFMLRRVKRNVQNELGEKIELDIYVDLSARQRALYRSLRTNSGVADLIKRANVNDAASTLSLMNLVMQFRKVCNHPELFERADVTAPFSFCTFAQSGNFSREGNLLHCPDSSRNPIEVNIPKLFYDEGLLPATPAEMSPYGSDTHWLGKMMNIWSADSIEGSLRHSGSSFSFLPLLDMTSGEAHNLYASPLIRRAIVASRTAERNADSILHDPEYAVNAVMPFGQIVAPRVSSHPNSVEDEPHLREISTTYWNQSCLSRPLMQWYSERALAPPIKLHCTDRSFTEKQEQVLASGLETRALFGPPPSLTDSLDAYTFLQQSLPDLPPAGLISSSPSDQLPPCRMQVPEAKRLVIDSSKLSRLDELLLELKAGGHRVLIYFQMTRMIDLMEEYMVYRQYKYLRLDGTSKLEDRRDMVLDWQTKPDIFIFLLSTRAGGLGINLTAADTVIFYDHDWNPSSDMQAMDRAHRLGQTRQVTVYRLITKGTIDERIVQLARVKKDVQDIVVGNKQFGEGAMPSDLASILLNEDVDLAKLGQEAAKNSNAAASGSASSSTPVPKSRQGRASIVPLDGWTDDGDDFFGHSTLASNNAAAGSGTVPGTPQPQAEPETKVKKKRGRKPNQKKPGPMTGELIDLGAE